MSIEQNKVIVYRLFEALNAGVDAMTAARPQIIDSNEISYFAGQRSTTQPTRSSTPCCSRPSRIYGL